MSWHEKSFFGPTLPGHKHWTLVSSVPLKKVVDVFFPCLQFLSNLDSTAIPTWLTNTSILFLFKHFIKKLNIIIFYFFRRKEAWCRYDSELLHDLKQFAFNPAGQPLCVYGDPACLLKVHPQGPFKHGILSPQMEEHNAAMSAVRSSGEWLYGDVVNSFKFNDFKKKLKLFLNCVGKLYVVSVILRNAVTCLYGNLTLTYFDLLPPKLDDYFA